MHSLTTLPVAVLLALGAGFFAVLGAWLNRGGVLRAVDRKAKADAAAARLDRQREASTNFAALAHTYVREAASALRSAEARLTPEAVAQFRQRHPDFGDPRMYVSSDAMSTARKELAEALVRLKASGPDAVLNAAVDAEASIQKFHRLASEPIAAEDADPLHQQLKEAEVAADSVSAALRRCCA